MTTVWQYREDNSIDLVESMKTALGENYEALPLEDQDMICSILEEIEAFELIHDKGTAAVALVAARQLLLLGQIVGSMFGQLGIRFSESGTLEGQEKKPDIKIVSNKMLPKGPIN